MDITPSSPGAPPPLPPPPPVITPPPPAKPRRSWGWMIVAIILIVLLGFSLLGNFAQAVSHAIGGGFNRGFKTSTARAKSGRSWMNAFWKTTTRAIKSPSSPWTASSPATKRDQAGNNMVDVIKAQLDRAKDDKRVKAVILKVDSPGGEVMASDEINKAIRIRDRFRGPGKPAQASR